MTPRCGRVWMSTAGLHGFGLALLLAAAPARRLS